MTRLILALTSALLTSTAAFAWGPQGHMVVAQIAENNLTPAAKAQVQLLLKGESMSNVATWADEVKNGGEYSNTKTWHYVDIPDGQDYSNSERNAQGDVVTAITEVVATLKNSRASTLEKTDALKFLIHFVGDIHQPLHVGRPSDRGGNSTQVTVAGRRSNLHAVWDTYLVMQTPMTYQEYANSLDRVKAFFMTPYDIAEFPFSQVIAENLSIRPSVYDFGGANEISKAYSQKQLKTINNQLLSGGKRLAAVLNQVFR